MSQVNEYEFKYRIRYADRMTNNWCNHEYTGSFEGKDLADATRNAFRIVRNSLRPGEQLDGMNHVEETKPSKLEKEVSTK